MEWTQKHWAKISGLGGTVIAIIGLASLETWREHIGDAAVVLKDNPISSGAILFGLVLIVAGNWERLKRLIVGAKRWPSDKELGDELNGWLRGAGYGLKDAPADPSLSLSFAFVATDPGDRPVTVIKQMAEPGVILQTIVLPDGQPRTIIENMNEDQRSTLVEDLGIELSRYGCGFDMRDILGPTGIVVNYKILLTDSMTQWQFLDRVSFLARAILLVQLIVTRHVRAAQKNVSATLTPVPLATPDVEGAVATP